MCLAMRGEQLGQTHVGWGRGAEGLEGFWLNLWEYDTGRCLELGIQVTFFLALPFLKTIQIDEINIWSVREDKKLPSSTNPSHVGGKRNQ